MTDATRREPVADHRGGAGGTTPSIVPITTIDLWLDSQAQSIELDRLRRLANRVITTQIAIGGADFPVVYRCYLEQTGQLDQSFERARRVFRGDVIMGGAPFTKDVVYLTGLLSVNYCADAHGRLCSTPSLPVPGMGRPSAA